MKIETNAAGHLVIGGCDALTLAQQFGTPAYVYDVAAIRAQFRAFAKVFKAHHAKYAISYASKLSPQSRCTKSPPRSTPMWT